MSRTSRKVHQSPSTPTACAMPQFASARSTRFTYPSIVRSNMKLTAFPRWWTATATSGLGSAVGGVALPLTALTVLHASPFEMGLITAAGYLAYLLISLPAGVIVERLPLRGTQVGADLVR